MWLLRSWTESKWLTTFVSISVSKTITTQEKIYCCVARAYFFLECYQFQYRLECILNALRRRETWPLKTKSSLVWFCHWNGYWNVCYWCHSVQPIYEANDTKQKMNFSAECNIKIVSASQSSWVNSKAVLTGISMLTLVNQGCVNKTKLFHETYPFCLSVFITSKLNTLFLNLYGSRV